MPHVRVTRNLQRHVTCPPQDVAGDTVRAALDAYFELAPDARGYVLDEHGGLRKHMAVFVNGTLIGDRSTLSDPIDERDTIDIMQALSGG
ncbi:MAG: MoaD/ThiS family protein [Planctomycetota bacterium]